MWRHTQSCGCCTNIFKRSFALNSIDATLYIISIGCLVHLRPWPISLLSSEPFPPTMATGTCPDCFSGTLSTGTPTGTITTIHDLPTYVTTPEDGVNPKGLVVFMTDAFGYTLPNSQVL